MNMDIALVNSAMEISPLRKVKQNGERYYRRQPIETMLAELAGMSFEVLAERAPQ